MALLNVLHSQHSLLSGFFSLLSGNENHLWLAASQHIGYGMFSCVCTLHTAAHIPACWLLTYYFMQAYLMEPCE